MSSNLSPTSVLIESEESMNTIFTKISSWVEILLGYFVVILLFIDIISNNWEIINFIGDARHLLTPLFDTTSPLDLSTDFYFPVNEGVYDISKMGRFMINASISQVQSDGSKTYFLGMGDFSIQDSSNDICDQLIHSYPMDAIPGTEVTLGSAVDYYTYIRGDALSHIFGDTLTAPPADASLEGEELEEVGYMPSQFNADLRLTTAFKVAKPGQSAETNISMYRFFSTSFCSGCRPRTELGRLHCTIIHTYNNQTKQLEVSSSNAIPGSHMELGSMFDRTYGPSISMYLRLLSILLLIAMRASSLMTIEWFDLSQLSWYKRLIYIVSPPQLRQDSSLLELSDLCFNSDFFVLLYILSVILDEEIAAVYTRIVSNWYQYSDFDLWLELRLMALNLRWLWLNSFIIKFLKWFFHFLSTTLYTGDNRFIGWLNFSSVSWVYRGMILHFYRHRIMKYGNSITLNIYSTSRNLDSTHVVFYDSYFIRSIPSLLVMILVNLFVILTLDHIIHWKWWSALKRNSLGRQLMYNTTSIICNVKFRIIDTPAGYDGTVVGIKARGLSTLKWFISSHLMCFGLPENPRVIRQLVTGNTTRNGSVDVGLSKGSSPKKSNCSMRTPRVKPSENASVSGRESNRDKSNQLPQEIEGNGQMYLAVQDKEGYFHVVGADKRQLQAASIDKKLLFDAEIRLS